MPIMPSRLSLIAETCNQKCGEFPWGDSPFSLNSKQNYSVCPSAKEMYKFQYGICDILLIAEESEIYYNGSAVFLRY